MKIKKTILFFVIGALFYGCFYRADVFLLPWLEKQVAHYHHKWVRHLAHQNLVALWTFDETDVTEQVKQKTCVDYRAVLAPGHERQSRYFDGSQGDYIRTFTYWGELGSSYTLSLWVKLKEKKSSIAIQDILFTKGDGAYSGIRLDGPHLELWVPPKQMLSYPFEHFDEWTHIAGVVDLAQQKAFLYENGELKASSEIKKVAMISRAMEFGKSDFKTRNTLHGSLDDVALWNRALSPEEIRKVFCARASPLLQWGGYAWIRKRASEKLFQLCRETLKIFDFFNPWNSESAIGNAGLPELDLRLSKKDEKYFRKARRACLRNGILDKASLHRRKIGVSFLDKTLPGTLALCGGGTRFWGHPKASFVMDLTGDPLFGLHKIVFVPPDLSGFIVPLVWIRLAEKYGWPHEKNGLAVLRVNGAFQGIYYFGRSLRDTEEQLFSVGENPLLHVPVSQSELLSEYDHVSGQCLPLFQNDRTLEVSSREAAFEIQKMRQQLQKRAESGDEAEEILKNADISLTNEWILGSNPSTDFVVFPLPLSSLRIPGLTLSWVSDRPEILAPDGALHRPASGKPVPIRLQLTLASASRTLRKEFPLSVMPSDWTLPALCIRVPGEITNDNRTYSEAQWLEDGGNRCSEWIPSQIKYRGNTALWFPQKPYGLHFFEKMAPLGLHPDDYFLITSTFKNQSFMRNKLVYDLFRDMRSGESPHFSPRLRLVELFLNGRYEGVYEFTERVSADLLNLSPFEKKDPDHSVLYKAVGSDCNFQNPYPDAYLQQEPDEKFLNYWEPYQELIAFIGQSSREDFRNRAAAVVDFNNVADFHLLLNLAYNKDGNNHNLFLARDNKPGSKFFIVPWDYDKSFGLESDGWLSNHLLHRLLGDVPEFKALFKQRWKELRQNQLAESSILERIAETQKEVKNAADRDALRWPTDGKETRNFEKAVQELKDWLLQRLLFLDEHIGKL